jgi:hypothetical protein
MTSLSAEDVVDPLEQPATMVTTIAKDNNNARVFFKVKSSFFFFS